MTLLEIMIVLAILALSALLLRTGLSFLGKEDLVQDANELVAIMRRASSLATEHGEMHRVVLDLDKQAYLIEVCEGQLSLQRNELLRADEDAKKRALDRAKDRMAGMPSDGSASQVSDPEEMTRRALAITGHHIADRTCVPATDTVTGDVKGKGWARALKAGNGIKLKEVWVQHKDDSTTKGQIAVYFFPNGSSEKAVIELTDGSDTFSVLVSGISGRIELKDGVLRDINEQMMRNAMGERDARREGDK
jgi:general secretion pathway protein H